MLLPSYLTHLGFLQASIDLPEVFSEELFSDGLSVDSNSLSDLDQMRGTVKDPMKCEPCYFTTSIFILFVIHFFGTTLV